MTSDQRPKEDPPPPPSVPSEAWIDVIEEQCTAGMLQRARRYAARRAHGVGHGSDDYYANELVQDALADTTIGVLHWDPNVKTLQRHIHDVVKMRTNYDRKRARRFPHESIDALTPDGEAATMAEVDAALLERAPDALGDSAALAAERVAKLRQLTPGDRPVTRLLDALASGATRKADVMRVAELSSVAYDNARRRLRRLVSQLSNQPGRAGTWLHQETEHAAP
jgi:hypothetical protein